MNATTQKVKSTMAKVVITKRYDSETLSIIYFRDSFSRGLNQCRPCNSIKEAMKIIDSYKFMSGLPVDARHVMRHDSSWHKVR